MPETDGKSKREPVNMPWFRMYHEFATDPKVQMLSEVEQRRYVMLLCLRCCNGDVTLQDAEVAFQLRISDDDWAKTKAILIDKNLIDEDSKPTSWERRQRLSDTSKIRVSRHRERKKAEAETQCNVTVTPQIQKKIQIKKEDNPPTPQGGNLDCLTAYELWNETALRCGLPQAAKLTPDRRRKLAARLKDYSLNGWKQALVNIERSSFLNGDNDRGWRANLDFLLQPTSFAKVHDGSFGNGRARTTNPWQAEREAEAARLQEMLARIDAKRAEAVQ